MSGTGQWLEPEVLNKGEGSGADMVVKHTTSSGKVFYGIGVPIIHWRNPLGPTWCYVLPGDRKITLIDTGMPGSLELLEKGLNHLDYSLDDVGSVIITHGHMDHDGNAAQIANKVGAEIVGHEIYSKLLNVDLWRERRPDGDNQPKTPDMLQFEASIKMLREAKKELKSVRSVIEGDTFGDLQFFYTPGHAPDELCILFDDILFTGDHLLPMITPHPTLASQYDRAHDHLPKEYHDGNKYYGIIVYLQALKKAHKMRKDLLGMPAHRLFYNDKFQLFGVERADEILNHHVERFVKMLSLLKEKARTVEEMLPHLFQERHLNGRGITMAIHETDAHLEVLKEAKDIEYTGKDNKLIRATGTENFAKMIDDLEPYESRVPLPE